MSPRAHLLGLPREVREQIYEKIVDQIQAERLVFEGNPVSEYDGLRLTCKQLYQETQKSVFLFSYTSHQLDKFPDVSTDDIIAKSKYESVRSIYLEIPYNCDPEILHKMGFFFYKMQLSIQELHIFFIGKDQIGVPTTMRECGKGPGLLPSQTAALLLDEGQHWGAQWEFLRQVALLRNLRILQIDNANLPMPPGFLLSNKPHLKALSVTGDPRSSPSSLSRKSPRQVVQLLRNLAVRVISPPALEVLSINANTTTNAETLASSISVSLRHLSLSVPNMDYQPYRREVSFYSMTDRLMHTLAWRAPKLETLRLCISMRKREPTNETVRQESETVFAELQDRLKQFPSLRHLEIHYRGHSDFIRIHLVKELPIQLSRLYLSGDAISVTELVKQVRRRYFTYLKDENKEDAGGIPSTPIWRSQYPFNTQQKLLRTAEDADADYLDNRGPTDRALPCGEFRTRRDNIPLSQGRLGFINIEYNDPQLDNTAATGVYMETDRTKILRLNGQLLDREHNFHLTHTQEDGAPYGIPYRQEGEPDILRARGANHETATYSNHSTIHYAIWDSEGKGPNRHHMARNKQELKDCTIQTLYDWDWYFGGENEAMEIFKNEPVVKVENQVRKSGVKDVEVEECGRCRWASPDFNVPAVGSFAVPEVPGDWRG